MSWTLVPLSASAATPWRNGGGVTRELLAWPSATDWRLRMSVADIASDGAFSAFPGIERWFAVLEGQGVDLQVAGARQRLTAECEPLRFDGGAPASATLVDGPTRDFNLMAAPGTARMQRVHGAYRRAVGAGGLVALYGHTEPLRVRVEEDAQDIPPATLAWQRVAAACVIEVDAMHALYMEVAP